MSHEPNRPAEPYRLKPPSELLADAYAALAKGAE